MDIEDDRSRRETAGADQKKGRKPWTLPRIIEATVTEITETSQFTGNDGDGGFTAAS